MNIINKSLKALAIILLFLFAFLSCKKDSEEQINNSTAYPLELAKIYDFKTESISVTSKKISWRFDGNINGNFTVDKKINNGTWERFNNILSNGSQYIFIDTTVIPDFNYKYYYKIHKKISEEVGVEFDTVVSFGIEKPDSLQIEIISNVKNRVSWIDKCNGEDGYKVDLKFGQEDWEIGYRTLPPDAEEFTDIPFWRNVDISYRVYTFYNSYISNKVEASVNTGLDKPENLEVSVVTTGLIQLTWDDNNSGEMGYKIDRKMGEENWEIEYALLSANTTHFDDDISDNFGEIYEYRVYTYYYDFLSPYAEIIHESGLPPPDNFSAASISLNEVFLTWADIEGEQGYKIDKKTEGWAWQTNYAVLSEDNTSFIDDISSNPEEIVQYRICSYYKFYKSDYTLTSINTACPQFLDQRDGKTYNSVQIGDQCWMQENLYYEAEGECYENDPLNCDKFGRLYDWNTALGICPSGWHLPSVTEWEELINYLGGDDVAGGKMKSTLYWLSPNTGATNSSQFSAFPGGSNTAGLYTGINIIGSFWTANQNITERWGAFYYNIFYNSTQITKSYFYESDGRAVRCVRD